MVIWAAYKNIHKFLTVLIPCNTSSVEISNGMFFLSPLHMKFSNQIVKCKLVTTKTNQIHNHTHVKEKKYI